MQVLPITELPVCPKCHGALTRHSFEVRHQQQIVSIMNTYHCAKDGDVVPRFPSAMQDGDRV